MKVVCQRDILLEALQVVNTAVVTRTPKPALQCVLVEAESDSLTLVATDLQVGIRYGLEHVDVKSPGKGLIPADRFLAIVRECPDKTLTLAVDGDTCRIDTSDSHFTLNTSDVESFPTVPESDGPDGNYGVPLEIQPREFRVEGDEFGIGDGTMKIEAFFQGTVGRQRTAGHRFLLPEDPVQE